MRFIVAVLAAFLALMVDVDRSPSPVPNDTPTTQASPVSEDSVSDAVPFAARFIESAVASEQPSWMVESATVEGETPAPASQPGNTAAEPQASAIDAFCRTLRDAAEASKIPVAFFARLIWQESRFRLNEVSHAGAQGVAQFMPETAAEVGLDDPFDPLKALLASAKLLRKLRDDFGNLGLAAAAYNAGPGRIQKWLARQRELPRETRDYVRIITGTRAEDWIEDADRLAIRIDLPREAPCEGIGGLSKSKDVTFVSALAAPGVTTIIRKAEAAEQAARLAAGRARKRLAILLKKTTPGAARLGKVRHVVAHAKTRSAKGRAIRLASRERSSS
ncbi:MULTISPECIES: lytic transglycosylase domain-containing protein [unclassified Bradyrhizobium]|uniref:lytic transglycosylase domain-containing protein n=1 Tax=unclassified Bradyrhizobium TaxID=2631580 RepID=UPI00247B1B69|nr:MULTISPECIES: lytic transglycosylase domain-containing protein [unclassified Bradyrhizobium]WGS23120.1 lytic transglycosylase domain-containing protein [Bradyrhizobium sp. ISRA463]WGS30124.1 lytic transglycosylase domain-containing protein [Bradyrhizobium sp. ISRA464]